MWGCQTEIREEDLLDLPTCLVRARVGDQEASRTLVTHLYPLIIKIVRAHLPRRMDEEDLVQIVLLKMFTHLDQYQGKVPFEHWVARISVNTCINQLRHEQARPELRVADLSEEEADALERLRVVDSDRLPGEQFAARELADKLLETLSPSDRLIVTWMDLEQKSVAEIRALTGWNTSLIKVRAFRARKKLRRRLTQLLQEKPR
jgi:RNA polymerase sigma factor (sigma-70 family)